MTAASDALPFPPTLAILPLDLSADLRFLSRELVLTPQALILRATGLEPETVWPIDGVELKLQLADHAGVGTLILTDNQQTLAHWHFTLSRMSAAQALSARFGTLQNRRSEMPHSRQEPIPPTTEWPEESSEPPAPP